MFYISTNGNINLTRGDTAEIVLSLKRNGEPYFLSNGDECVLTLKEHVDDDVVIFQKQLENGQFRINPEDTESLKYGQYVYDVQATLANGDIYTVVTPHSFYLTKEVTRNV